VSAHGKHTPYTVAFSTTHVKTDSMDRTLKVKTLNWCGYVHRLPNNFS